MNLKMRSCKKSVICADIYQLWIFALIYGGIIFFSTFFDFYLDKQTYGNAIPYSFVNSRFFVYNCLSNFCGLAAGAVLALKQYSYLYSTKAISFYHGLPFKRKSLFVSKLLSGIILLTVPVLVNFAIVALTKLCGSDIQIRWLSLIYWFGNQMIYSLFAFSCVTFAVMLSGNILSLLVTCLLLGIAPAVIIGFIHTVCGNYLLGYAYNPENFITFFYIMPDVLLFKARGLIYVIAIPALLVISYFMYKKRDLERCGEAVVFPKVKIAFVYFAGLLGGIFSYFYFSIWNFKSILFMLPFGLAAVIIANMINRRSITIKGALLHSMIFTVLVILLLEGFSMDVTGFEKRIPDIEKVDSVTVIPDTYYNPGSDENDTAYNITDIDDIKTVAAYHRYCIDEKTIDDKNKPSHVTVSYNLKSGRTLKRIYSANFVDEKEYFEEVAGLEQVKKRMYPIYNAKGINIVDVDIHNFLNNFTLYPNDERLEDLLAALNEDVRNLTYDENATLFWGFSDCSAPLYIDVEFKNPVSDKPYDSSYYFPISFGFTNTMELLKKYGVYDSFMTVKNIVSVGIDRNDDEKGSLKLKDDVVDEIITDPEKMQEILDSLLTGYRHPEVLEYADYDEYIFLDDSDMTHNSMRYMK